MGALRFLLAIAVFATHAQQTPGFVLLEGLTAVNVFFVISGFLMQLVLTSKYTSARDPNWRTSFYIARIRRLYPMYFATALCLTLTAGVILATRGHLIEPFSALQGLKAVSVVPWLTMIGLNIPPSYMIPSGAFWTLGLEMGFYLVSPWILRWPAWKVVALISISAALRAIPYYSHIPILPGLDFFLLGAVMFRCRHPLSRPLTYPWVVLTAGAIVLIGNFLPYQFYTVPVLTAFMMPSLFAAKVPAVDGRFGDLSYPIYLSHEFAIRVVAALWRPHPTLAWTAMALLTTVVFAALLMAADRPVWHCLTRIAEWIRRRAAGTRRVDVSD